MIRLFGYQSKSNPVSMLPLFFPLLVAPVIVCVWLIHRREKDLDLWQSKYSKGSTLTEETDSFSTILT